MAKVQTGRLEIVVDELRKFRLLERAGNAPTFDMGRWASLNVPGVFKNKKDLSCASAACAIGTSAHRFNKLGFKLKMTDEMDELTPVYKNHENMAAVEAFFGLNYEESRYLFHPEGYPSSDYGPSGPSATEVADRIEDFVYDTRQNNKKKGR